MSHNSQLEVSVARVTIIAHLQKHKEAYQKTFKQATEDWAADLTVATDAFKQTPSPNTYARVCEVWHEKPKDYTEEYDVAITMLELAVEDHIKLSASEAAAYLSDRWNWQTSAFANAHYSKVMSLR